MIILPAIDLMGGRCVRLRQGRAQECTVYNDDPVAQARAWYEQGARELHVVDLDGAFGGEPHHAEIIAAIAAAIPIPVEVGGGLRSAQQIEKVLQAGVARAILGTAALVGEDELARLVERFGSSLAIGIDARDGYVSVKGWVETTTLSALELGRRAAAAGVATIIYTDIATDGMLGGPNLAAMAEMCATLPDTSIIASGGVSAPEHVTALKELSCPNLYGAIVGKALYDGKTTLAAMRAAAGER